MSLLDTASLLLTPNAYKEGKLYSVIPSDGSGDMSVTRATTATRVNSAGLVELVPYNLLTWSQTFTNGVWGNGGYGNIATVVANDTTAPDGTMTASKATFTAGSTQGRLIQQVAVTNGGIYSASIYVKYGNKNTISFYCDAAVIGLNADFNFTTKVLTANGVTNPIVTELENGWFRLQFQYTAPSATSQIGFITNVGEDGFIYTWGAQLVEGTLPKDYQKTETRLNIPRLDYSNGTCPSLLVEPQRTNLALRSQEFDNASWVLDGNGVGQSVTANYSISPDGTQNAYRLQLNKTGGTYSRIYQNVSSGTNAYSFTVYMKSNTSASQNVGLRLYTTDINCVVTTSWQRFELNATVGTPQAQILLFDSISGNDEIADISIWGAQLEVGSYPTSYIPTTSASVTRNADVISKTGISSLIGQSEGTLYFEGIAEYNTEICSINQNTQNSIFIYSAGGYGVFGYIYADGSNVTFASFVNPLTKFKAAIAYKTNSMAMYINGNLIQEYTGFSFTPNAALTTLFIAQGGYVQGKEKVQANTIALYKTRLTNDELEQLTGTGFDTYAAMASFYNYTLQ